MLGVDRAGPDTGRLRLMAEVRRLPAGAGHAVGRPVPVEDDPASCGGDEPVVLVATDPMGFRHTAARVELWRQAGRVIGAIVLAGDEARLVAARIPLTVPIVDGVDAAAVLACDRVAVEVARPGGFVARLADPIRLARDLGLGPGEHDHAAAVAERSAGWRRR